MQVPKAMIVALLRERGNEQLAAQAQRLLPEQVDVDRAAEVLKGYGVDLPTLLAKLPWPLGAAFKR